MNYLAHVFLARHTAGGMIGGLLGDFAKGSILAYPPDVQRGIRLHRAIDRYTDGHVLVRAGRGLISPARRRYAGIMLDVFYDHFLACHWQRYSGTPLHVFTCATYAALLPRCAEFPVRLQTILPRMAADDWLASYRELWAVEAALNGIARRFKRANTLGGGVDELVDNYAALEAHFLAFFPQLERYVGDCASLDTVVASRSTMAFTSVGLPKTTL
jgi:acyl carrier protein phosphodiesterase